MMRCHARNIVRWMVALILVFCYTLLVILWQDDRSQVSQWSPTKDGDNVVVDAKTREVSFQERAPRSIQDDVDSQNDILRIVASNKHTAKDSGAQNGYYNNNTQSTSLDDLFISVKTTKSFHQSRLNIILKTWFVLAREQVS